MRAYAGFQAATVLWIITQRGSNVALCLLVISIPSTIAYAGLARLTPEDEQRNPGLLMAICFCCAFLLSIAAFSILLAPASTLGAIAFPAACAAWFIAIWRLRIHHH